MLIRITNRCSMGCSHCFIEGSGPEGEHMDFPTFQKAVMRIAGHIGTRVIIISGGEPLEHPEFFDFMAWLRNLGESLGFGSFMPIIASNGLFVLDERLYDKVERLGMMVQVTNDQRFYPRNLDLVRHKFEPEWISYTDEIQNVVPCRRTAEGALECNRMSPPCFNLRSATRSLGLHQALSTLEVNHGRFCCPSVNIDGTVMAGEMDTCHRIGSVDDAITELEYELATMQCNECGLRDNLEPRHLEAIGEGERGEGDHGQKAGGQA
jgi:hypothetical protein